MNTKTICSNLQINELLDNFEALKEQLKCLNVFSINSWADVLIWQTANGVEDNLDCLFKALLIGHLFSKKIHAAIDYTLKSTSLADAKIAARKTQLFLCDFLMNLKHSIATNLWHSICAFFSGGDVDYIDYASNEDMKISDVTSDVFYMMSMIDAKFPLAWIKIFAERPKHYCMHNPLFVRFVQLRLWKKIELCPSLTPFLTLLEEEVQKNQNLSMYIR